MSNSSIEGTLKGEPYHYSIKEPPLSTIGDALEAFYDFISTYPKKILRPIIENPEFVRLNQSVVDLLNETDLPEEVLSPYKRTYSDLVSQAQAMDLARMNGRRKKVSPGKYHHYKESPRNAYRGPVPLHVLR